MLNYFSSIALQEKVISALVRLPQNLSANEREFRVHEVQLPDHSLKVIPNPFHADAVVTTSNSTLLNQASTITINDLYGRTMKSASYYNNYQLDRTGIPSGVYLVKVVTASGVSAVTKIIIL